MVGERFKKKDGLLMVNMVDLMVNNCFRFERVMVAAKRKKGFTVFGPILVNVNGQSSTTYSYDSILGTRPYNTILGTGQTNSRNNKFHHHPCKHTSQHRKTQIHTAQQLQNRMMELARGIEESGKPFIWAIRPPIGFELKEKFRDEWLPHKLEERMSASKRGLLVHKWAPQLDILCHKSTGAFLSHCGWNSTLESLSQGVPLIGWPLAAEQLYNSKMIEEEMGVGVELTKGLESCITKNHVKTVIDIVMENEEIRKKASQIGEMIKQGAREYNGKKGSSLQAMDDFVSAILSFPRT